jgi:hypothetical protein
VASRSQHGTTRGLETRKAIAKLDNLFWFQKTREKGTWNSQSHN